MERLGKATTSTGRPEVERMGDERIKSQLFRPTIGCDDSTICLLKIVRQLVTRLIQLDVISAGHDYHDDPAVLVLLDRTPELRSLRT